MKSVQNRPVHAAAVLVDPLKFRPAADAFSAARNCVTTSWRLFAADRQALAALGAAALEHQTAVLRAHSDQKPVRLFGGGAGLAGTCACPS